MRRRGLRALRKARGMTQEELAQRMGKERSAISKYETGVCHFSGKVLEAYADIFQMTMDEIYRLVTTNTDDQAPNGHTDPPPPAHGAALPARSAASHPAGTLPPRRRRASRAQH